MKLESNWTMASRTVWRERPPTTEDTPAMTKSMVFSLTSCDKSLACKPYVATYMWSLWNVYATRSLRLCLLTQVTKDVIKRIQCLAYSRYNASIGKFLFLPFCVWNLIKLVLIIEFCLPLWILFECSALPRLVWWCFPRINIVNILRTAFPPIFFR